MDQSICGNRLLALMPPSDFAMLAPHFEPMFLRKGHVVAEPGDVVDELHWPSTGVVSVVAISPEGQRGEVGLFGREGCGPLPGIMGSARVPHEFIVQVPGEGHRLGRPVLLAAMDRSPTLRDLLIRYAQTMMTQTSFTALSNAVHPIEERLARWLLMCHDRIDGDEIALTHDFISVMLAVRRPSVTTCLHVLEGHRLVRSERGHIVIRDRKALEEFAGDSYGTPEAEYLRLIGPMSAPRT